MIIASEWPGIFGEVDPKPDCDRRAIYALVEPDCGQVRYIGNAHNPKYRYMSHANSATQAIPASSVSRWFRGLVEEGRKPGMAILDWPPSSMAIDAERFWIAFYAARDPMLLNRANNPRVPVREYRWSNEAEGHPLMPIE